MKRLTKEDILEGTRKRVNLAVKEYGREVVVRPLSDEEITQIISKITPGTPEEGSANPQIDLQKKFRSIATCCIYRNGRTTAFRTRCCENEIWGSRIYRLLYFGNKRDCLS
jgi:hypothetical protein